MERVKTVVAPGRSDQQVSQSPYIQNKQAQMDHSPSVSPSPTPSNPYIMEKKSQSQAYQFIRSREKAKSPYKGR